MSKKIVFIVSILFLSILLAQGVNAAVNLISPANNTWVNNGTNPTFVYNHTMVGTPVNCTVNVDSIGAVNFTFNVTINTNTIVVSNTPLEGTYNWNVSCVNSTSDSETSDNWVLKNDNTNPSISSFAVSPNVSISENNMMIISADVSDVNLDYVDIEITDTNNLVGINQTILFVMHNESGTNGTYTSDWGGAYLNITNGTINELITASLSATPPTEVIVFGYFKKNATEPAQSDCALVFNASAGPPFPLPLLAVVNRTGDLTIENGISNFTVITYRFFGVDGPPTEKNGSTFTLYSIPNALNPYLEGGPAPSGDYEVSLMAWDSLDNTNIEITNITVDNDIPTINLDTPVDTANLSSDIVNLTFDVTDDSATLDCSLYINSTLNATNSSVSKGTSTTFTVTFSDGSYSWYINCSDEAGNINVSSERTFSVDTGAPAVTFTSPSNNSWQNANFAITATITDGSGVDSAKYRWENSTSNSSWTNMSYSGSNSWNATFNLSDVNEGNFTIRINATDSLGYNNTAETLFLWKDVTDPTITSFSLSDTTVYKGDDDLTGSCSANDTLDSSVLTSVGGIDTSETGTFTATCTATDNAGNTDTSSKSYTIKSKSTTGTAGTYTAPDPNFAQAWSEIKANSTVDMSIAKTEIGFTKMSVDVKNEVRNVNIKVTKLSAKPANTKEITRRVYQYIQVDKTNIKDEDISEADVEFRVEKSWLTSNNIAENNVALNRYTTEWTELSTTKTGSDTTYVHYKAATPGFSYFAIAQAAAVEEEIIAEEVTVAEEVEEEVTGEGEAAPEEKGISIGWIIAAVILVIVIVYLVIPKKKRKE